MQARMRYIFKLTLCVRTRYNAGMRCSLICIALRA